MKTAMDHEPLIAHPDLYECLPPKLCPLQPALLHRYLMQMHEGCKFLSKLLAAGTGVIGRTSWNWGSRASADEVFSRCTLFAGCPCFSQ